MFGYTQVLNATTRKLYTISAARLISGIYCDDGTNLYEIDLLDEDQQEEVKGLVLNVHSEYAPRISQELKPGCHTLMKTATVGKTIIVAVDREENAEEIQRDEKGVGQIDTLGGAQQMSIISESGL